MGKYDTLKKLKNGLLGTGRTYSVFCHGWLVKRNIPLSEIPLHSLGDYFIKRTEKGFALNFFDAEADMPHLVYKAKSLFDLVSRIEKKTPLTDSGMYLLLRDDTAEGKRAVDLIARQEFLLAHNRCLTPEYTTVQKKLAAIQQGRERAATKLNPVDLIKAAFGAAVAVVCRRGRGLMAFFSVKTPATPAQAQKLAPARQASRNKALHLKL